MWVLKPIDQETTRLITRGRNRYTWKDVIFPLGPVLTELGDPFMMRKQLRNLKRRAEQLATARRSVAGGAAQEGIALDTLVLPRGRGCLVVIEAEADIQRSPEDVFDYCSDLTHELEWKLKMTDRPLQDHGLGLAGPGAAER